MLKLPKILTGHSVWIDDFDYAGIIQSQTLPALQMETVDVMTAGMVGTAEVYKGFGKLQSSYVFKEYKRELFLDLHGRRRRFITKGYEQGPYLDSSSMQLEIVGPVNSIDMGSIDESGSPSLTMTVTVELLRLVKDGETLILLDIINAIYINNGIDYFADRRNALDL